MREYYIRFSLHAIFCQWFYYYYCVFSLVLDVRWCFRVGCSLHSIHLYLKVINLRSYRTWLYGVRRDRAPLTPDINKTLIYVKWAYDISFSLVAGTRPQHFLRGGKFSKLLYVSLFRPTFSNLQFADCLTSWTMSFHNIILTGIFSSRPFTLPWNFANFLFNIHSVAGGVRIFLVLHIQLPGAANISYASR